MKFILKDLNPHHFPVTSDIEANLQILLDRLNQLVPLYGKALLINSGLRSQGFQDDLIKAGKSNAPHSKHLTGEAVDLNDPDGAFHEWCKSRSEILESIGFWCEERQGGWQHLQISPPHSGHRWFFP